MVLCAAKAEPVSIHRGVGFVGPNQASGLVCLVLAAAHMRRWGVC